MEVNPQEIYVGFPEPGTDLTVHNRSGNKQFNPFRGVYCRNKLKIRLFNLRECREGIFVVRPREPDRIMGFPLRRHMEPTVTGCVPETEIRKRPVITRKQGAACSVRVRAPVPEEPPRFPDRLVHRQIKRGDQRLFRIFALHDHLAKRVTDKRSPEEPDVCFLPHPVEGCNMDTICYSMTPLDEFPCYLPVTFSRFLAGGMPDGSRIKNNFCPVKSNRPGSFGEPLVIADEHRDTPVPGCVNMVPVPGVEVSLLKKTGVLRYVDFVIGVMKGSVRIDDYCTVIEPAIGGLFIERDNDNNLMPAGNVRKCPCGFSRNRFCEG